MFKELKGLGGNENQMLRKAHFVLCLELSAKGREEGKKKLEGIFGAEWV